MKTKKVDVKYIAKKFRDKFPVIIEKDFKTFLENLEQYNSDIKFIALENYNLPNLHYRIYHENSSYKDIKKDYFSDCNGEEIIMIYDVEKNKFVEV